ncbi:PREDICTED: uncharacterized protein LOC105948893 isoform X2 [Erythranthe guttata]|nr:PREDICTED: uncharacterized protein LOC105948893 isoform X2 [Erythranthe guttata]|eukprot:XP_012827605.1 PREDICTED: uncharacterized protein LOC105948893 isoform X2 [Erythranthe guttata]
MMDKSWMTAKKFSSEYVQGVRSFMKFVDEHIGQHCDMKCPCTFCLNSYIRSKKEVLDHLLIRGIDVEYTRWIHHGECFDYQVSHSDSDNDDVNEDDDYTNGVKDLLADLGNFYEHAGRFDKDPNPNESEEDEDIPMTFLELLNKAEQELYPGCSKFSTLSFIVHLLHIKVYNKWSNKSFDMMLTLLKKALPHGETLPKSYYDAKKILNDLGLGYTAIHACKYDCALFWKDYENCQDCPVCGTSRWKVNNGKGKKIPHKILRHFPLKPRLQRMFMSPKIAAYMRWHSDKRINDEKELKHPADARTWKKFDQEHPNFSKDGRNVRLALATDGFNPFGTMSNSYNMWPVIIIPYNLPPWKCMKKSYFIMSLLIPGPHQPGKDIDIYLQPLVDELKDLWNEGVQTYDAFSKKNFQMHAALLWTINDFPAYGCVSGWSTKGYMACPVCNKHTCSKRLRSKICYMGHRRYLPRVHKWRKNKIKFDGKEELSMAPDDYSGNDISQQTMHLKGVKAGKHPRLKKNKRDKQDLNWTKRSILFELPYWKTILLRHNLDVMHIEKNICDNILGTLLNMDKKTKDTYKARKDLEDMNIRQELHLKKRNDGRYDIPPAAYAMSKKEGQQFCEFLKAQKFPDGYASNISRCVNVSETKLVGLKSHDCHVLLQRLLPYGIRGCLSKDICVAILELGDFFQRLCCRKLLVEDVNKLEKDIVEILCKLEMIFPPAFFDVMVHLAVHLPHEVMLGGPVQYRWMYPIERYLGTLKGYVRNKARPEGSIAEAYIVNECLTFCSMYLDGIETSFNKEERNMDIEVDRKLSVFSQKTRTFGAIKYSEPPREEVDLAHWYILNNCEEMEQFHLMHKEILKQESILNLEDRHKAQFPEWFKHHMAQKKSQNPEEDVDELYALACGPSKIVNKYPGCIVNGVRFHTKERDSHRTTQNSGVMVEGYHNNTVIDFYGTVIEIIELDYIKDNHVILFKAQWFNLGNKKSIIHDGKITSINISRTWYEDDPFIFACQTKQVFYLDDMKLGKYWKIVVKFQHRHVFDSLDMDDGDIREDDNVYQEDESSQPAISIQGDLVELVSLERKDVDPEVVQVDIIQDLESYAVEDDAYEEDDTLDNYCDVEEEFQISDDDSDLE